MIRPANPQDLPAIAAIYEAILAEEDARPVSFTNWQRGKYPTVDTARCRPGGRHPLYRRGKR